MAGAATHTFGAAHFAEVARRLPNAAFEVSGVQPREASAQHAEALTMGHVLAQAVSGAGHLFPMENPASAARAVARALGWPAPPDARL
jgi:hypothetical protein